MTNTYNDEDDWDDSNVPNDDHGDDDNNATDRNQGYQALLDPDEEESSIVEHDDEDEEPVDDELPPDDDNPADRSEEQDDPDQQATTEENNGNTIKEFTCHLCSISFSKFEGYREHFVSIEHRYKRRDEKKRLGDAAFIETTPVEVFVNVLLYNKIPLESVYFDIQPVDFSVSGILEYNSTKYEHQHASSLNDLHQALTNKFNQDHDRHQLKMPPQSFFVARDVCRKEADHLWTIERYQDDSGKSDEKIVKEVLDFCVYNTIQPERERLIGQSIQTWRMFHRQETKAGFWCDICKQCFRKRKAILCHFESSEKHESNLKHLPPYRQAVQHSLFTGRLLNEFVESNRLNYYRARVNAYRIPPSNKSIKNAYYCTFCKKSFESAYALEKHLTWKGHRELLKKRRQNDMDNMSRLVTYLNYNQLSHEQRNGGIQQMPKTPEEYRSRYNLIPLTLDDIQEDIKRFDTQLAQQVMQNSMQPQNNNMNRFQRGGPSRRRGRNRPSFPGQQSFRGRGSFQPQYGQSFNSGPFQQQGYYQPRFHHQNNNYNSFHQQQAPFRGPPPSMNYAHGNNKRSYPPHNSHNSNHYNPRHSWPNKRPRFDRPSNYPQMPLPPPPPPPSQPLSGSYSSGSNRVDYRYVANQNNYQQHFY